MTTNFDNHRQFAQKLSNVFLQKTGIKVSYGRYNIAYVNVRKREISFDFPKIFSDDLDNLFNEMMTFKGLLFHEIHHIKHTVNSKRYQSMGHKVQQLVQILEDGRIETLGVLRYQKLVDYFIYSVNNVLLKHKDQILKTPDTTIINDYILMYGRKLFWQDKEIIKKVREMCVLHFGHEITKKIEDYVDAYIFETKSEKRLDIAQEIYNLLLDNNIEQDFSDFKGTSSVLMTGRNDPKTMSKDMKEIEDMLPRAEQKNKEIGEQIQEETKDAKDGSGQIREEKEQIKKEVKDLRDKRDKAYDKRSEAKTDKTWEKWDDKADKLQKEVYEKERELRKSFSPDGAEELAEELADMIESKQDEQDDLIEKNENDLVQDLKSVGHSLDGVFSDSSFMANPDMQMKSKQLEKSLKKLNTEMRKGYVKHQKTGKINARSFINRKNLADTKIFNKYLPDQIKKTKILCNIFIDGSGSMNGQDRWGKALKSLWVINEALNRDQNKILVYQFSSNYQRTKVYDKPLSIPRMLGGGTNPAPAIKDAIPLIEKYKAINGYTNVVDIIITDGDFDYGSQSDAQIMNLNKLGHETILINIEGYRYYRSGTGTDDRKKHKAKHYIELNDFDELVPRLTTIFTKIKKSLVRSVM